MRHLGRFRVPELAPNALLRALLVPKPLARVSSRPSSAVFLMRFSNRSCALSATRWGDTTLRVNLSTPNLNPSTLNGSADALRTFSEHPLTLSDGNFSLGSAAVGVSPLECKSMESWILEAGDGRCSDRLALFVSEFCSLWSRGPTFG